MLISRAFISLGGNQGDVATTVSSCLSELNQLSGVKVVSSSRNYLTAPIGSAAENLFVNAAAELETTLTPPELLHQLQLLETKFGRVRTIHWGPRTLDLDLILFDDKLVNTPELTVPHPAAWYRRFVLKPLAEIAPEAWHPEKQSTIAELLQLLELEPYRVFIIGNAKQLEIAQTVAKQFSTIELIAITKEVEISQPHSLLLHLENSNAIPFSKCPLKTRFDLSGSSIEELPQLLSDIFTSALGSVELSTES